MDLGDILRTIRGRWYIMLPIVLITVAVTVLAYLQIPTKYESTSEISLLSPQQPASGSFKGLSNPFLGFDTSLTAAADLLARNLSSDDTVRELKGKGVTEEYTAKLADFAQGPFLAFTVTGTGKDHVLASTRTLTTFAQTRLREIQRQNGAPEGNLIKSTVMIAPQPPQPQTKDKLQNVLALFAVGIVAAFMATFVTEGLARSRSRNRASGPVTAAAWRHAGESTAEAKRPGAFDSDQTTVLRRPPDPYRTQAGGFSSLDTAPLDRIRPRNGNGKSTEPSVRNDSTARLYRSASKPDAGTGAGAGAYPGAGD